MEQKESRKNPTKTENRYLPLHRDVYESKEWQELSPYDRAQLLLVAEGSKPGTYLNGDFTHFQNIVKKLGLESFLNTEAGVLQPVYAVATGEQINIFHMLT